MGVLNTHETGNSNLFDSLRKLQDHLPGLNNLLAEGKRTDRASVQTITDGLEQAGAMQKEFNQLLRGGRINRKASA